VVRGAGRRACHPLPFGEKTCGLLPARFTRPLGYVAGSLALRFVVFGVAGRRPKHVGDSMQPAGDGTIPCRGRGIVESVELVGVAVAGALRGSRIDTKQNTSELS
jgi:hypothetical protein